MTSVKQVFQDLGYVEKGPVTGQLEIYQGFRWGAGSDFKWTKDGYNIWGVGINMRLLDTYDLMEVKIAGNKYRLNTLKAKEFIKKYQSYQTIKNTKLGIVSKSLLRKL